jgi:SAM-dependent methyltransferase
MTQAGAARHWRYTLEGDDEDLRRLLRISELMADSVRAALRRLEIPAGSKAIECGCGPIGGLAVLAEMVGPAGRVTGVDLSELAIQRARSVIAALALDNVEVVVGDVHDLDGEAVGGPFDLAYTRCFLLHQSDTAVTLKQIARLIRPGGWIVCQEPLRIPAPQSHPHLDILGQYWELLDRLLERVGVAQPFAEDLSSTAADCGLEVHQAGGFFNVMAPDEGFDLHAATLDAIRGHATHAGVATSQQIDELLATLRIAAKGSYQWVTSPFFLDLALRKRS